MVNKWSRETNNGSGPGTLRKVHRALVLRELALQPGISRSALADRLGLSLMGAGRIVRELEQAGLAGEAAPAAAGRGRPAAGLSLVAEGAVVVGAVLSAYTQEVHLLNLDGRVIASKAVKVCNLSDGPGTVRAACKAIKQLVRTSAIAPGRVAGIGFSVAATVNPSQGSVTGGGYLGWQAFALRTIVERALHLPVTVNNIADSLLRAESFSGCAHGANSVVLIHCATILGASHLGNDTLTTGANYQAGRIGHYPMRATRLRCSCGESDCLNCSASGWAVLNRLKLLDSTEYQSNQVHTYSANIRALVNNEVCETGVVRRAMADAGAALARGLRLLDLTFDPDQLILAGPLASHPAYYGGVLSGLANSGPSASDIAAKVIRAQMDPGRAAGVTALLDTVFSPTLDLQRLSGMSDSISPTKPSTLTH